MFWVCFVLYVTFLWNDNPLVFSYTISKVITSQQALIHRKFRLAPLSGSTEECPVDPLDNIKATEPLQDIFKQGMTLPTVLSKVEPVFQPQACTNQSYSSSILDNTIGAIHAGCDRLERVEASIQTRISMILEGLPLKLHNEFNVMCRKYVERIAVVSLSLHAIVLLPFLQHIKIDLGMSIFPYLYLGPLVFFIPFLVLWLWENNFIELQFVDDRRRLFIVRLRDVCIEELEKYEEECLTLLREDEMLASEKEDLIYKLAYWRLFSELEVGIIAREILDVKERVGITNGDAEGFTNRYLPGSMGTGMGSLFPVTEEANVGNAVQRLLAAARENGDTQEETLEQLKQLQKELDGGNRQKRTVDKS